jgi:hypothetical protein
MRIIASLKFKHPLRVIFSAGNPIYFILIMTAKQWLKFHVKTHFMVYSSIYQHNKLISASEFIRVLQTKMNAFNGGQPYKNVYN